MADSELQEGDLVMLKSGGPVMTVEEVSDQDIHVVWFDEKNNEKRSMMQKSTLKKYDGPGFA